jgi:hypothetical protein
MDSEITRFRVNLSVYFQRIIPEKVLTGPKEGFTILVVS